MLLGSNRDLLDQMGAADERDYEINRLQALLSQWLRMENVVVLVGSGCSKSCGGKLLNDLEKAVLQLLKIRYEELKDSHLSLVIERRISELEKPGTCGFEDWLSYLSNAHYLLSEAASPVTGVEWKINDSKSQDLAADKARILLTDLSRAIYAYCALSLRSDVDTPTAHHAFLAKLIARDPALGRGRLFTTNYDTLVEQALDDLGAEYVDGFVGRVHPKFNPACYSLDMYYPGEVSEGRVRRYDKFVQLYKLHGSIHWREEDGGRVIRAEYTDIKPFEEWRGKEKEKLWATEQLDRLKWPDSFGILPTANKFVQTLDLPYAHLFRAFHQALQQPQTFFLVLGYGFGDKHINRIIDDAMANPSLVLLVVDPVPSHGVKNMVQRYQTVGERAFLLTAHKQTSPPLVATFEDFSENVLPQVQWLEDWVKLRKLEKTLHRAHGSPEPEGT